MINMAEFQDFMHLVFIKQTNVFLFFWITCVIFIFASNAKTQRLT